MRLKVPLKDFPIFNFVTFFFVKIYRYLIYSIQNIENTLQGNEGEISEVAAADAAEKVVYMLTSSLSHKDAFAMACDCLALHGARR